MTTIGKRARTDKSWKTLQYIKVVYYSWYVSYNLTKWADLTGWWYAYNFIHIHKSLQQNI